MKNLVQNTRNFLVRMFYSFEELRLRAGWRLLVHLILLLSVFLVFGIVSGIVFNVFSEISSGYYEIAGQTATLFAITLSVFIARKYIDKRSISSLGLRVNKQAFVDLLIGIGMPAVMLGFVYLIEWNLGWLSVKGFAWQYKNTPQIIIDSSIMMLLFVVVGWQEELLSRGYWLQNITEGLNLNWGMLISSSAFALLHLGNPNVSWNSILGLVLTGIFLAYAYVQTNQLWLPIGIHIGWNFFEGTVYGFRVSGLDNFHRLIEQEVNGPELITGGNFGPEAGLVLLPALLLGVLMIRLYTNERVSPNES